MPDVKYPHFNEGKGPFSCIGDFSRRFYGKLLKNNIFVANEDEGTVYY